MRMTLFAALFLFLSPLALADEPNRRSRGARENAGEGERSSWASDSIELYRITIKTRDQKHADTDDLVHLKIYNSTGTLVEDFELDIPHPHNDRERGETDYYVREAKSNVGQGDIGFANLETYGSDKWRPQSVHVTTLSRGDNVELHFNRPYWTKWLSTDQSEGVTCVKIMPVSKDGQVSSIRPFVLSDE